jgi:hypothetical protein
VTDHLVRGHFSPEALTVGMHSLEPGDDLFLIFGFEKTLHLTTIIQKEETPFPTISFGVVVNNSDGGRIADPHPIDASTESY